MLRESLADMILVAGAVTAPATAAICPFARVEYTRARRERRNYLFGSARKIKFPSQSGFATPSRYA
jgi:hypothetical protein